SSSRPMWCWLCSCAAVSSPTRRSAPTSSTTTRSPAETPPCRRWCSRSWRRRWVTRRRPWTTSGPGCSWTWATCMATPPTVWNALVHGFGGMRQDEGEISFDPRLPDAWPELVFPLTVRGSRFRVRLLREEISLTLETGDQLEVSVRGQRVTVTPEGVTVPLE